MIFPKNSPLPQFFSGFFRLVAVFTMAMTFFGCQPETNQSKDSNEVNQKKIRIALLPKIKGIPYFTSCADGAREAVNELGNIELIYDGPIDGDARKQAEMIEQWTVDGVDAICVSPNAPDVVVNAMKDAMAAGVKVLTWDADSNAESRSFFINQATPRSIAEGMVDALIKDLGGPDAEGDVVIISSDITSDNQNSWIDIMKPAIENSKLKLQTIKYPGENSSKALADSKDVIKKYPNLRGVFGISSVSFPGAAEAVEQTGNSGKILVVGLSTPNVMKPFVERGTVKSVVLWNTKDLGYLTVYAANALVQGKLSKENKSFAAGRLGDLKIEGDNIILGDILVFTKDNIDQFNF